MRYSSSSTVLKSCILIVIFVVTSGFVVAADQKSNPNPCNVSADEAAGLNRDLSTDVHAANDYVAVIARLLKAEEFDTVDCLADHARSGKERFPGGAWKIHTLYGGLSSPVQYPIKHATEEDWTVHLQRLQRWVAARPKSITARVALAWAYTEYAANARGSGYANTVSESGWKLYGERTAEAKRILEEASALPTKCPEWYVVMQKVAQSQSWDMAEKRALFTEATKFEPGYYTYARVFAYDLLPKWSGESGDTEKFMQDTADQVGGEQGDILYFQVASANYVLCGCDQDDPHLSWERIVRGFQASEKQYGVSMLNLNRMAYLASHFGNLDPIVADTTLTRIGEQWDDETWEKKEDFEMTKKWAAHTAPFVVKRREMEAAAEVNMQTSEGLRYKASFEGTYRGLVQECVRTDGSGVDTWEGRFVTLASVGAKGTIEDSKIYSTGPVVMCLYQKLRVLQQERTALFPPPPKAPYWVRVDLNWADFAPVAAK